MIEVKNVSFNIGRHQILQNISFELRAGELVAIVGPNGAGKSTLLKAIAGDFAVSGEILYDSQPIQELSIRRQAERRAFLEQQHHISFPFTSEELIRMGQYFSEPSAPSSKADNTLFHEVLEMVGVAHLRQRRVSSLSGGEAQRVHTARILLQAMTSPRPHSFIFLDEPISSLDINHQYSCLSCFKKLSRKRYGVIAVLHDLNIAAQFADRILMMHKGRLVASGSPHEVLTRQNIKKVYEMDCEVLSHPHLNCPMMVFQNLNLSEENNNVQLFG